VTKSLFQLFHENGDIPHASLVVLDDLFLKTQIAPGGGAIELVADRIDGGPVVEVAESLQESFAIHRGYFIPVGFLDEEVEVVGHYDVSDDPKPEKRLKLSHKGDEVLPLLVAKDESPVNDAGVPRAIALRHSEA